jgi:hypothetical protein
MLVGVLAGIFYMQGTKAALFIGALIYQSSLVLDCVDGQLARCKNMSSEFGRMLDGAGDYVVGISVLGGVLYGVYLMPGNGMLQPLIGYPDSWAWVLLLLSFISVTIHSVSYDYIKVKFSSILKTGFDSTEQARRDLQTRYLQTRRDYSPFQRFLRRAYIYYSGFQYAAFRIPAYSKLQYSESERKEILDRNRRFFRLWSWVGPNSHLVVIVLATLVGDAMLSAFFILLPMNIYFGVLLFHTRHFMGLPRQPVPKRG